MSRKIGFYDKIKTLEEIDRLDKFPSDFIDTLIKSIKKNKSLMIHFAENVNNDILIRELYKKCFFDEYPEPIMTDKGIQYQGWMEGKIILRFAEKIPDVVLDVIKKAKTKNVHVYTYLLEAALKLDADSIHSTWSIMISWLVDNEWIFYPDTYTKLAIKLIEGGYDSDVIEFLRIVLKPIPPKREKEEESILRDYNAMPQVSFWKHERYEEKSITSIIERLEDKCPLATINLIEEYLNEAIEIEKNSSGSDFVETGQWRAAIEKHEQNIIKEFKDYLLNELRNTLYNAIKCEPQQVRNKIEEYISSSKIIFKRLGLYLISAGRDKYTDLAEKYLLDKKAYNDFDLHHEFFVLLKTCFQHLQKEKKVKVIEIIKSGPGQERIEERKKFIQENFPKENVEESTQIYEECWIRDRLYMISDCLEGKEKDYLEIISRGIDFENYHPDFHTYIGKGGFVSHIAPINEKEWQDMPIKEKIDFLIKWKYEGEKDFSLEKVCPKGFGQLLKNDLKRKWYEYKPELIRLIKESIYPHYTYNIIDVITETIKALNSDAQKDNLAFVDIEYEFIIDVISTSINRWRDDRSKDDHETGYSRSNCISGLNALGELIEFLVKNKIVLMDNLFGNIRDIFVDLCAHEDPTPEADDPQDERYRGHRDPITTSINHIRPIALRELLRYSVDRAFILDMKDKSKKWETEVENKVTEMLSDPAFSVRAVLGECWRWLCALDNEWAEKHFRDIFPENYEDRYFIAAWDGYIVHKYYVNDARYDLMRPLYIYAIDNTLRGNIPETHLRPGDILAEHLAGFYQFGIEILPKDNPDLSNPLAYLYSKEANRITSHMIWVLWRRCEESEEIKNKKEIWEKSITLWKYRLESVKENQRNDHYTEEMIWFVHFLTIKELDISPDQIEDLLLKSIEYLGRKERDHGIHALIEYLAMATEKHTDFSVKTLKRVFDRHGANWYFEDEEIKIILESATKSTSWEVKKEACSIVHKLGEYGHHWARDYLDQLRS